MKDFVKRTSEGFSVYKVAILKLVIGSYLAGLAVWTSGQYAWGNMSADEKINTMLCISGAMGTYVLGFFDRTLHRIAEEQKPKSGDTQFIEKPKENDKAGG